MSTSPVYNTTGIESGKLSKSPTSSYENEYEESVASPKATANKREPSIESDPTTNKPIVLLSGNTGIGGL